MGKSNTVRKKTKNETTEARGAKKEQRNNRRAAQFFKNKAKHNQREKMPQKTKKMRSALNYKGALRRPLSQLSIAV